MKLNSSSVNRGPEKPAIEAFTELGASLAAAGLFFAAIAVTAPWLYGILNLDDVAEYWPRLYADSTGIVATTGSIAALFLMAALLVFTVAGVLMIVEAIQALFLPHDTEPEPATDGAGVSKEVVESSDDYIRCSNGFCECSDHHLPRPDVFIDGRWEWQPSCNSLDCNCPEHANDELG